MKQIIVMLVASLMLALGAAGAAGAVGAPAAGPATPASPAKPLELWFYYSTNLLVPKNIDQLDPIFRRAAKAGYSKVMLNDSKFARLAAMPREYFANVDRVKKLCNQLGIEIVPCVYPVGYSEGVLSHNPNWAEGLPVRNTLFLVKGGEARVLADPAVDLPPRPASLDDSVKLDEGSRTATVVNNPANARLIWRLNVSPFRCYHVSVKVRTQDYTGQPEIKALAAGKSLTFSNLGVKPTQDWTEHHAVFDSLDNKQVAIYLGVWGDAKGTLQWKDWNIEEVGLVNVLRRQGTPLTVRTAADGRELVEGKDFDPVKDERMGQVPWQGSYEVWHTGPAIKTHGLADGTKLRVSWYYPPVIYGDQVTCCLSEPDVLKEMGQEARQVGALFGARALMMGHDEIRVANWDETCQAKNQDAGKLLAENIKACTQMLPNGTQAYAWSDMFDPYHNAHGDYYLVRGSWAGSWEGLDKGVTVVNWNSGKKEQSLKFFADRGHEQVIAGYYDGPVGGVRSWMDAAAKVPGVVGVMYTTWEHRYADLEEFARVVRGE